MKLTRKWKLIRTGFFLDFFSLLILTTGSWDSPPVCLMTMVTMVTMGPVCLMKLTRKRKLIRTPGFFLDFFPQLILTTGSWDSLPVYLMTMGPFKDKHSHQPYGAINGPTGWSLHFFLPIGKELSAFNDRNEIQLNNLLWCSTEHHKPLCQLNLYCC